MRLGLAMTLFITSIFLGSLNLVGGDLGYNNPNLPSLKAGTAPLAGPINYSMVNVNNSQFLQGLTPQQVANLYIETDPLWSANSSTVARTGSCPQGSVVQNTTTGGVQCVPLSTYNITYDATTKDVNANRTAWFVTYNSTYDQWAYNQTTPSINFCSANFNFTSILTNLTAFDCPGGQLVIGVQNNGTVLCATDSVGITNSSFNQSLTDTLYASIIWGYNQTIVAINDINSRFWNKTQSYNKTEIDSFNASWTTTFNSTYDSKAGTGNCPAGQVVQNTTTGGVQCVPMSGSTFNSTYDATSQDVTANRSAWFSTYNLTYDAKISANSSFNQSLTDTLYAGIEWDYNQTVPAVNHANNNFNYTSILNNLTSVDCAAGQLVIGIQANGTVLCATDLQGGGNSSFNQSLTDTLYASIIWGYNQTTSAINDINSRFWNRTQSYNNTEINSFNNSWSTTFNSTYNNLIGQQCPTGQVVNGTLSNGTFTCITDQSGGGGGNPFNQVLNTTYNVTFANITISENSQFNKNVSASWFKGLFNWIIGATSSIYLSFDGGTLDFNEANLNTTIKNIGDSRYLNLTGTNANQNINITPYNISASYFKGDGSLLTNLPAGSEVDPRWSANSSSVARNGTCPNGQVVMNSTISGVQCTTVVSAETDPRWTTNSTLVPYLNQRNTFTQNQTINSTFSLAFNSSLTATINWNGTCLITKTPTFQTVQC